MRLSALILLCIMALSSRAGETQYEIVTSDVPKPAGGSITRLAVTSGYLGDVMTVDVWLPEGYDEASRYPVVYAHDGQSLFDPSRQPSGAAWDVDRACMRLGAASDDFAMPIVVGITSRAGKRPNDLFPEKALDYIAPADRAKALIIYTLANTFYGDEYAAFIALELKPLIEELFAADTSPSSNFIMGSSMGGLASLYIMSEYPDLFGGAACLSTHWMGSMVIEEGNRMKDDVVTATSMLDYFRANLPADGRHRLYLDQGTIGWDGQYHKYEWIARDIAREKGYTEDNGHLYTYIAEGGVHAQFSWRDRVHLPLGFLLSRSAIASASLPAAVRDDAPAAVDSLIYDLAGRAYDPALTGLLRPGIYIYQGRKIILPRVSK